MRNFADVGTVCLLWREPALADIQAGKPRPFERKFFTDGETDSSCGARYHADSA